jgi:uncharacterized membrane protein YfcA
VIFTSLKTRLMCHQRTQKIETPMPFDMVLLLTTIALGAILQVGIGIGFSIVVGPLLFLQLGTETAVPLLLLLNAVVSAVATPGSLGRSGHRLFVLAVVGSVVGIALGIVIYPQLTEAMVLAIAGALLVTGALTSLIPPSATGRRALLPVSGLSGLATVWAATPGPLMALGLLQSGQPVAEVRKLVQPIALIGYSVALALHASASWQDITAKPYLTNFLIVTVIGSLVGRKIGPALPAPLIASGIRGLSFLAGLILLYRAAMI